MKKIIMGILTALTLYGCNGNAQQIKNKKMKLIYVMDPLCGWCYGNSTNTQHLFDKYKNQIDFEILPAGMWVGENARKQSKPMAQFIQKHDLQIQQATGTAFGPNYFKFVENENIVLDSEIPSRAIVTVKKIWATQAVPFAIEVQKARYLHAKDLNDDATYVSICENLKLDKKQFLEAFHSQAIKKETQETFALAQQYARSYPTLLAEKEGKIYTLEQGFAPIEGILKQIDSLLK
jgi:putative protein-disulfide isomerase